MLEDVKGAGILGADGVSLTAGTDDQLPRADDHGAAELVLPAEKGALYPEEQGDGEPGHQLTLGENCRAGGYQAASMSEAPARSRMFPPLPCLSGLVLGLVLDRLWPWPVAPYAYVLPAGLLLMGLFVAFAVTGLRAFKRHSTSADARKETTAIIDTGPFSFSRNPGYFALAILQAALGLLFNNAWALLMIIPALIVVHYVVVLKEEAYLEARFGQEYLDYKSRVRRWI